MAHYPLIMAALMAMVYIQSEAPTERPQLAPTERPQLAPTEWADFKVAFNKIYASKQEELLRQFIFLANKVRIEKHNRQPDVSFKLGLNHLSDKTEQELAVLRGLKPQEMKAQLLDAAKQHNDDYLAKIMNDDAPVPDEVDWRKVPNRVSAVKDQGDCGSCWAFSATGALEGQEILRNMTKLIPLSEQNLVDCVWDGCKGGTPAYAFQWIALNGIENENDYPYVGKTESCRYNITKSIFGDSGWLQLPQVEKIMKKFVAVYGPVSVGIDASSPGYHHYKSGIYKDNSCKDDVDKLNHGVLVVGYGTDKATNTDYWLVKNSWGANWGEQGYIRMARNANNMCGIVTFATVPTFQA